MARLGPIALRLASLALGTAGALADFLFDRTLPLLRAAFGPERAAS